MLRVRTTLGGAAVALAALASSACTSGSAPPSGAAAVTTLGGQLQTFLDRVGKAGAVAFTANYEVLQKLGGTRTEVTVESAPPSWRITAGDVVVVAGPSEATCRVSTTTCHRGVDEAALSATGVFSSFFAAAPAQQVRAAAVRPGAAEPTYAVRQVAGVSMDCVTVSNAPLTACLTPEGVFGLVDDSARRFELTSYSTVPPTRPIVAPFPVS